MESVSNSVSSQIATQAAVSGALPKTGGPSAGQTGQAGETKNLFKNQPTPSQNLGSEAADNAVKDLYKLANRDPVRSRRRATQNRRRRRRKRRTNGAGGRNQKSFSKSARAPAKFRLRGRG